jgi:transglutaminase-like putative cysteine protease
MSKAVKPRQLNSDELLRLKWLLGGAMSLVALWTVFFLDIEALSLVAIASAVVIVAVVWPQLPARLPALLWKLAVPGIIVAMAADFYFSPDTLPVLIRLAILLVLYRAVAYRKKREDLQLLVLGLFLIVVAGVLTVSIGFAFMLLAFTACALGFLFVINLVDATESSSVTRTPEAATAWTRLSWRGFLRRLWAVADWRLLGFAATLFTAVVVMSGLLFMIIPRFEVASGFFLDRYITRKSRSGFTDTVRFGDVTELMKDDSIAMRVDLTDSSGIRENPYWRLVVLDEYTHEGFRVSGGLKNELLRAQRVVQQVRGRAFGRLVDEAGGIWTLYVEPGVSRYLPLPGSYAALRLRDAVALQVNAANRIVALRTESMTMTAFQLEGVELTPLLADVRFPQLLQQAELSPPGDLTRYDPRLTLRVPEGEANRAVLRRVVAEISGGQRLDAEEFVQRATAWLQSRHAYALSVKIPPGEGLDSIVRWLDSNEPGFCEYFAAALTVLVREAGHPARVVAGFHGGVLNGFENYFMVKNSDAHAWVEVYDGKSAWFRADPTPGNAGARIANTAAAVQQDQDSSWSARVDSLRILWYRRIVNFDSRQQVQMMEQVKTFTTDSSTALRAKLEAFSKELKAWLAKPWDGRRLAKVAGSIAGVIALVALLVRLGGSGWQRWRRWRQPQGYDPVRLKAGRWIGRLRGRSEDREQTTEDRQVIAELQRLRYGRRETWPEPRGVFRRAKQSRRAGRR